MTQLKRNIEAVKFDRKTFQGAYVFTTWIDGCLRTVQVFADNKKEALGIARQMFLEILNKK